MNKKTYCQDCESLGKNLKGVYECWQENEKGNFYSPDIPLGKPIDPAIKNKNNDCPYYKKIKSCI